MDAYHKLRHTIEEVNGLISAATPGGGAKLMDPVVGNVAFSAANSGWSFTLLSFAQLYADVTGAVMDCREFARRLWGDIYFHPDTRTFRKKAPPGGGERSFISFVLEPLYKMYSQLVGEHPKSQERMLAEFGVFLKPSTYSKDVKPLLAEVRPACLPPPPIPPLLLPTRALALSASTGSQAIPSAALDGSQTNISEVCGSLPSHIQRELPALSQSGSPTRKEGVGGPVDHPNLSGLP